MRSARRMARERSLSRAPFGTLPDGSRVEAITLESGRLRACVLSYGATLQSVVVPDRNGQWADVTLGHATLEEYLEHPQYFGSTVGRVANRIANGRCELDGSEVRVPVNNGAHSLHGGTTGFDKVNWDVVETCETPISSVTLRYVSRDGDQGYPGTLTVTATFALADDTLSVDYRASTDRPTLVNLSNHAYWNLAGEGAPTGAMDHLLTIHADRFLPTDDAAIPTGEFRGVAGTVFDFRRATRIGDRVRDAEDEQIRFGRGYDHNWVVTPETLSVRPVARLEHPGSGRAMELLSNQPGVQFYSGNFLDGSTSGKAGRLYRQGDAVVLEPQMFPDTPNRPTFGSVRLDPGATYHNVIQWRFSTTAPEGGRTSV
ncbi:MAG: aldose epimerase family protein [Allosphingosinicella sp.]